MVLPRRDPRVPLQGSIFPCILSSSSIFLTMPLERRLCREADLSECWESFSEYRLVWWDNTPISLLLFKLFPDNNILLYRVCYSIVFQPSRWLQEGRNVEIYNSFEIDYKIVDGKIQMNMDYLNVKQEQCKEMGSSVLRVVLIFNSWKGASRNHLLGTSCFILVAEGYDTTQNVSCCFT